MLKKRSSLVFIIFVTLVLQCSVAPKVQAFSWRFPFMEKSKVDSNERRRYRGIHLFFKQKPHLSSKNFFGLFTISFRKGGKSQNSFEQQFSNKTFKNFSTNTNETNYPTRDLYEVIGDTGAEQVQHLQQQNFIKVSVRDKNLTYFINEDVGDNLQFILNSVAQAKLSRKRIILNSNQTLTKSLIISSVHRGIEIIGGKDKQTLITTNNQDRAFTIFNEDPDKILHFTIKHVEISGNSVNNVEHPFLVNTGRLKTIHWANVDGGGLSIAGNAEVVIEDSTIVGNTAGVCGGGIVMLPTIDTTNNKVFTPIVFLYNNTLGGNAIAKGLGSGGLVDVQAGILVMQQNTLSNELSANLDKYHKISNTITVFRGGGYVNANQNDKGLSIDLTYTDPANKQGSNPLYIFFDSRNVPQEISKENLQKKAIPSVNIGQDGLPPRIKNETVWDYTPSVIKREEVLYKISHLFSGDSATTNNLQRISVNSDIEIFVRSNGLKLQRNALWKKWRKKGNRK